MNFEYAKSWLQENKLSIQDTYFGDGKAHYDNENWLLPAILGELSNILENLHMPRYQMYFLKQCSWVNVKSRNDMKTSWRSQIFKDTTVSFILAWARQVE